MPLKPLASIAQGDIACVSFAESAAFEPFIAAARAVAADLKPGDAAPLPTQVCAQAVRGLGLAELIGELHARGEAMPLLFHLASTLSYSDVEAAWAGLHGAPAELLAAGLSEAAVALPRSGHWGCGSAVWLPLTADGSAPQLVWTDAAQKRLFGPLPLAAFGHGSPHEAAPLLGLPQARLCLIAPDLLRAASEKSETAVRALAPEAWPAYVHAQAALLLGLIDGACRRLVQESFTYAKQRQSAGKPIAQHQAVALRLADLALNQQALSLYATAAVEHGAAIGAAAGPAHSNAAQVDELAFRISRDAVQIAAAHGYVDGLPFKRLFEQLRTLSSVLGCILSSAPAAAEGKAADKAVRGSSSGPSSPAAGSSPALSAPGTPVGESAVAA